MMLAVDFTLHGENFGLMPLRGRRIRRQLNERGAAVLAATKGKKDPDVTVLIRTKNDHDYMKLWFEDIAAQDYNGKVEIILVDTESNDGTAEYARSQGAKVISISQAEFSYPKALNLGFEAAKYPYVVTMVGHSCWSNRLFLKSLTYWHDTENFGGMFNYTITGPNASWVEGLSYCLLPASVWRRPKLITHPNGGVLGANASIVKRAVWEAMGGYDERYGAGGEDLDLARRMLARGYKIIREPLLTMCHAHGVGFVAACKQMLYWYKVGKAKPLEFDAQKLHAYRADLRQKH